MLIRLRWIVLSAAALALSGCLSQTDREAIAFPAMPGQARYLPAGGRPLSSEATIDALQTAEATCRNQNVTGAAPAIIGTPAFDACMRSQGYRRVQ
jgi:hypothetical protein